MPDIHVVSRNELIFDGKTYRCAVGLNGFTDTPAEGGKATPAGTYALRECWYRADRLPEPETGLPLKIIQEDDGWCDDPTQYYYNRPIKLPSSTSHENLWREEHVYDIIVPIGFNDHPVIPGKGSAIFLHLALPDYSPTLGCIAVSQPDMLGILQKLNHASQIIISES